MERARRYEEDVVGLDHAVLGGNSRAFHNGEEVSLDSLPRDIRAAAGFTAGDLIDFVKKDDSGVFHPLDGQFDDLVHIDKALRFLLHKDLSRFGDFNLTAFGALRQHGTQHVAQVEVHFFHAGSGKDFDHGEVTVGHIQFHITIIERTLLQQLAEFVAGGVGLIGFVLGRLDLGGGFQELLLGLLLAFGRQENIQQFLFGELFRFELDCFQFFRTNHADCQFHEIPDHGFHIPAHVAYFGKFTGLDF